MSLPNPREENQKKILVMIVCVAALYIDFNYILKAQFQGLKNVELKAAKIKDDLDKLNRDLSNMQVLKNKKSSEDARGAGGKSLRILTEGQLADLLEDISTQANKLNITINQIRPSRESQAAKAITPGDKFIPLLINLDLVCDYHNLGKFINILENSPVFMAVQELKISTQLPDYLKQKVILTLRTYESK